MNALDFVLVVLAQPLLPGLPLPPELEPHSARPVVMPLENDTLGVALSLGSPIGFELFLRQDDPVLSYRGGGAFYEHCDFYSGVERKGWLILKNTTRALQVGASVDARDFRDEEVRSFSTATLFGFLHRSNTLSALELQGYRSTMTLEERKGVSLLARLFWQAPWFNTLFRLRGALDPKSLGVVADGILQYQSGFLLLTPNVQARLLPGANTPLGAGAGLNIIAVFGNLSLELDGRYSYARPVLPDTILLNPVKASLAPGIGYLQKDDRLSFGLGYKGVEMIFFAARGDDFFWGMDSLDSLPVLDDESFSRVGAEVKIKLERPYLSNNGFLRLYFNEPGTSWTPPWAFTDSLTARYNSFGAFGKLDASGALTAGVLYEAPAVVTGVGIFYESEPFRVVLRVDDILDRRPQLWPGLFSPGRRVSLLVTLFSSKW